MPLLILAEPNEIPKKSRTVVSLDAVATFGGQGLICAIGNTATCGDVEAVAGCLSPHCAALF